MPYCEHCGDNITSTARFCRGCGRRVVQRPPPRPGPTSRAPQYNNYPHSYQGPYNYYPPQHYYDPEKANGDMIGYIGIVLGIIGLFIAGIIMGILAAVFGGVAISKGSNGPGIIALILGLLDMILAIFILALLFSMYIV